jgi:endothelin-converting enzyme/putative endopeptidase
MRRILPTACLAATLATAAVAADAPYTALPYTPSLDVAAMDRAANPCEDLYQFACGGWQKANPIPADQASWSVYGKLYVDNQRYLWGILEDAARTDAGRTPTAQKTGDFFSACMDESAIDAAGLNPLRADLDAITSLSSKAELGRILGMLHARTEGAGMFFTGGSEQDAKDSSKVIGAIYAGGLGLPDRDYYVKDDEKSKATRERYLQHLGTMFELLGDQPAVAKANALTVMRIETALAKASLTRVEKRDPYKLYHPMTAGKLAKIVPSIDWDNYFAAFGLASPGKLDVTEPAFMAEVEARLKAESLADLKTYLRWGLVNATADYLAKPIAEADFDFYRRYLRGVKEQQPRWKKCVGLVDRNLGEALGKEFVDRAFPKELKADVVTMTQAIQDAMKTRIEGLDWMSAKTKKQASTSSPRCGTRSATRRVARLPDRSTSSAATSSGTSAAPVAFETKRQLAKIGKPVDRGEWGMTPPTVNAYYNGQMNDMNFPAGVLLPPLYDPKMDAAPNYGNTGRHHRPRADPRVRRRGEAVRRRRQPARLVDEEGRRGVREARRVHPRPVLAVRHRRRHQDQREAHLGRGHRRSRRAHPRLGSLEGPDEVTEAQPADGLTPISASSSASPSGTARTTGRRNLRVNAVVNRTRRRDRASTASSCNMPSFRGFSVPPRTGAREKPEDVCRVW